MEPSYMMQVTTALSNWRESLLKVFRMVMVLPPSLSSQEPSNPVYRGVCYGNAMLHHVGAPISQLIAPVTFMWRPFSSIHIDIDVENDSNLNGHCMSEKSECSTSYRQLWVWIHAAAFSEGFGALRYACQELVHENGASVNCFSLEGKLAKLEVMGAKAIQVLQKILHPVTGWSIILPLSWVKAFWIPLVSHGARAIGLRERQWVSCDDGVPSFPSDFPDCKSYSCFMSAEATASDQRAELCPLAMRPLRVPIPPPWYCVSSTVKEGLTSLGDDQTPDVQTQSKEMVYGSSLVNPDTGNNNAASPEQGSFPGFIARTSDLLSAYLNEIHCCHLPLFPNTAMGKRIFSELMDKGRLSWAPKGVIQIPANRKLCFLRVLLHAYKEGVFEEGAVVCAPILTDLSLWTTRCRSDEQDGLKIPQSSIKSYFIQQQSGKWELQRPEDPVAKQSHRWPIGFVTTGFVRGSTKPVAEAFCEAALLAQLRGEQWSEMQEKGRPEIFVLVRNLRSAAYRLALATIVVEQQAEDMEFT
ncbi:ribonucleases P/MRP protein subunit POP1 isoform X7 [Magnolia sinica]|uniref:ribonucleases P/MRP protein subunit POP1 isoform X7 n=1 Tax=Magnolia sinica TaxID=86752 RepID=UPI00265A9643|nr:ribonucleases P/MRP protein subunit POP1 isoform X7 [Magnolia sinica]